VNKVPLATRLATTPGTFTARDGRVLSVSPYFTFKAKALSAKFEVFAPDVHAAMMGAVPAASSSRPVWIIGELPYKAQDNGMHFYNWMRRHHPEIDAYYVIDADSPERRNLEDQSHVVDFGSRRHVVLALQAQRFIGSHHPDFLYPTRNAHFVRRLTGARVFLQHGVMGTKWMVPNYGKNSPGFETDLFLASSEHEKSYLVHDFGYSPQDVVVTGLPRFDRLLAHNDLKNPRRVIVMPTWRDWLQSDDESFLDSSYYSAWKGFLSSESFAETVRAHDLDVVLCLHPNMQRFSGHFAEVPARIVAQGEENVQDLLMGAACMITDYSSVGFDFSFQHRPVLYYQFDRPAFLGRNGSHLDLDSELPGLVRQDEESALRAFAALADHDFVQDEELRGRADRFLDHRDTASNERVFRAVATAERKRSHAPGELAGVPTAAFRRFRKHRFYYPLMKNMSRLLRLLPVKQDVLVFESGLGKQYADSPRYIYEELIRRGDTRTKVWIHSGSMRPRDPETKIVKRLSPSYYYYVARAAFITTNQNLPFYLKRHRRATYVQTWHGTPLKRMQHDMVDQSGHRDDYLRRVEAATSQWTHLLSPSPYATRAFRSAFRYNGPVVEEGYPRNDPLLAPDADQVGAAARRRLGIAPDAKVVLYAPTFRDRQTSAAGRYSFELPVDLEATMAALPDDVVLLLRMHVLVGSKIDIPGHLRDRVKNVSEYPEIQELYLASDVLVTDYSSVFFDDALLRRPIIFHAYDLEEYRDQDRGFYLDYEKDLPGPISRTQEELVKEIMSALDEPVDQQRRQEFLDRFAPKDDGHAAQRVVDRLYSSAPGTPALTALRSRVAGLLARARR
jgi:CDP-glycerol glycerophosphotransferase